MNFENKVYNQKKMSALTKQPTERIIGQTASHHQHDQLKNALIIKAKNDEPEHFMKCIQEKLVSFIPAPYYDSSNILIAKHSAPWTLNTKYWRNHNREQE